MVVQFEIMHQIYGFAVLFCCICKVRFYIFNYLTKKPFSSLFLDLVHRNIFYIVVLYNPMEMSHLVLENGVLIFLLTLPSDYNTAELFTMIPAIRKMKLDQV